ncbi:SHOCT domain-containing protein [Rhodoferax lacus]|nr:SHOCT domain-containing protein [Rhodoferax lacus]
MKIACEKNIVKWLLILGSLIVFSVQARELFDDGKKPTLTQGQSILSDDTIGGYPIYVGGEIWRFEDATLSGSTGSADSIPLGLFRMRLSGNGSLTAYQGVQANLRSNSSSHWSGSPCSGGHLYMRNKARGKNDNCLTIDAVSTQIGSQYRTLINVHVTETGSSGKYYSAIVSFDAESFGFPGSTVIEWNKNGLQDDKKRATAFSKITAWAEKYQDAAETLMDYNYSKDAFANVPTISALMANFGPQSDIKPQSISNAEDTYVYCKSTKKVIVEGSEKCPPSDEKKDTGGKSVEQRMQDLKRLFDSGLIDKELYQKKQEDILKLL